MFLLTNPYNNFYFLGTYNIQTLLNKRIPSSQGTSITGVKSMHIDTFILYIVLYVYVGTYQIIINLGKSIDYVFQF